MRRLLLLLLVSAAIFELRADAVAVIVVAALAAAIASQRLPGRTMAAPRPLRLLAFLPYFAIESARGGVDVARRAFRGRAALRPGYVEYASSIRDPVVLVIFANAVSLMPGTLTAQLDAGHLLVHTLDVDVALDERLRDLEQRIRHVFGDDVS